MNKSTPLSSIEWGQIRQHAIVGAEILSAVPTLVEVAPVVRAHHERYDGSGYPQGLSGEAIPRLARVLAVADTYCALCSDRPYRHELTPEQARAVIVAGAGVQFDPAIVEAFVRMLDKTLAKS
jgi:HD-GYP domain-containing protein (c-di-GMP phosphodiesterase class II)